MCVSNKTEEHQSDDTRFRTAACQNRWQLWTVGALCRECVLRLRPGPCAETIVNPRGRECRDLREPSKEVRSAHKIGRMSLDLSLGKKRNHRNADIGNHGGRSE